jgi:alpha-tubulin suppressor-like RCC1 family protein
MRRRFGWSWLSALLTLLGACGEGSTTGLMLIVDADDEVRGRAATLEVRIRGEKGGQVNELDPVVFGDDEDIDWPRSFAIIPKDGDTDRTLRVQIAAREGASTSPFVEAKLITGYVEGRRVSVRVILEAQCIGVACGADETCLQGECVDARDAWQGDGDAGIGDGGTTPDCEGGPVNACNGCGVLDVEPGTPCGPCDIDEYVCSGTDTVVCSGQSQCWTHVAAGSGHSCARLPSGALRCWGYGEQGQLGDGTTDGARLTPTRVLAANEEPGGAEWNDWTAVAGGFNQNCGLRADGGLWCWGETSWGQLGDGVGALYGIARTTPIQVLAFGEEAGGAVWSDWQAVAGGDAATCGLRANGTLWCWGGNSNGQLGAGIEAGWDAQLTPVQVVAAGVPAGGARWSDWQAVTFRIGHACGLRAGGTLWCWGQRSSGRLGDGYESSTSDSRNTPVQVLAADEPMGGAAWNDWVTVAAGGTSTCGIRAGGTLWCWGNGTDGRRGDGTTTANRGTPTQVLAAGESAGGAAWSDWTHVAVGGSGYSVTGHACGIREDGTLWCWGTGNRGQRGDGTTNATRTTPVQVLAAGESAGGAAWNDWTAVATGGSHTCGLRANGTLWCWGAGLAGARGDGDTTLERTTPIRVLDP